MRRRVVAWLVIFFLAVAAVPAVLADRAHIDSVNATGRDFIFSNIEESIRIFGDLVDEARGLDYAVGEARALVNLGVALYLNGRYDEGVEAYLRAIRLLEAANLRRELATAYGDLGYQMKRRDLARARHYMQQGIAIAEAEDDSLGLCALYDNFGVLEEMGEDLDGAAAYYQRALDLKSALQDSLGIPFSLNNLAGIAIMQGGYDDAARYLGRSDAIRRARRDAYGLLRNNVQWGALHFHRGDLDSARVRYERCLTLPSITEQAYLMAECRRQLALICERQGDPAAALVHQRRATAIADSLFSVESSARIAALEIEFETEKKDRLLAEQQLEITARSRTIGLLLAGLVGLVGASVGVYRYQVLRRSQLQREMDLRGQLRRAEYDQQMADEKLRIARELHDNIGAQLTFLTSSLDNLSARAGRQSDPGGEWKSGVDRLSAFGRQTLTELRQTVWAMKSEGEGWDALVARLQELKRQGSGSGRRLEFTMERQADVDLTSGRLLNLFRIAQEAVQNALKYTREGPITLELRASDEDLTLRITDTGPGFDPDTLGHVGGVAHMRQRCEESGGVFTLASGPEGTSVMCRFAAE